MTRSSQRSPGFSLVEVTLALGIAGFSMIAIFGLLVTGTQTNHTAIEQTACGDILTAVAADLRATPKTNSTSTQFGIAIPPNPVASASSSTLYFDPQGAFSASLSGTSRYRLIVTFLPNGSGTRTATFVDLKMTWPAAAATTGGNTGAAETFVALDRN